MRESLDSRRPETEREGEGGGDLNKHKKDYNPLLMDDAFKNLYQAKL